MKRSLRLLVFLSILFSQLSVYAQADTILARYKRYQLDNVAPPNIIPGLIATWSPAGQWSDIDYKNTRRANWSLLSHLGRISSLAVVWSDPGSGYYHSSTLWRIMNSALDHWLEKRYQNSNWWSNEIGVPRIMRDILVLLHDTLSASRLVGALDVMHQLKVHGTGANLIWSADLGLHYGALTGNDTMIRNCARLIAGEIRITAGDGVQADYSFLQHDARLQMYQYGAAFLQTNARLAWELEGTSRALPIDKIKILAEFALEGWQWMARGINSVPGTMDRSASRMNALKNADLRGAIPYLCRIYPSREKEFLAMAAFEDGKGAPLQGFRYFPYADFSVYQNRDFSFFLKTLSVRTLPTESINSENLKGKLLNSGDAYIVKNGQEYFNLMPVWDWNKLPGVTSFDGAEKIGRRAFTGGVTDGRSGLTVMDYEMQGTGGQSLTAAKCWACHNGLVVCLIAGLRNDYPAGAAFTALDQCRWQGDVTVSNASQVLQEGDHLLDSVSWIQHAGIAYIFLKPSVVRLHMGIDTGSWHSINASEPAGTVKDSVFTPVMLLPATTAPISTGYVLAYCRTSSEAQKIAHRPSWNILRNDRECQAVQFGDGMVLCAFYTGGTLSLEGGKKIAVDKPCLILLSEGRIYASDPAHQGAEVKIVWNGRTALLGLPKDGTTIAK